ncbi:hypothetical protein NEMIN01_1809 [Nematocida minor]|uniref:uncharacterized protein n=1 Tax=Nematocida minor TaxID=1912983 RepID=UPI00221FF5B9|nr:uncharacterized protein NEMIN01_1809 [Nematocida minor]KAI5192061.1 hypothetical protein NEMIN01_1809 [Nematocida minor]
MTEGKKSTQSVWKRIKTTLGMFTGAKQKKAPAKEKDSSSDNELEEEAEYTDRPKEDEWISASKQIPSSDRKMAMYSLFDRIEERFLSDSERIELFKKDATSEMLEWWAQLTVKPIKWEDLKSWLIEDIDSVEVIQKTQQTGTSPPKFY